MVAYVLVFEAGSLKSVLGCQFSSSGGGPAHEALRTLESIETVGVAGALPYNVYFVMILKLLMFIDMF